MRFLIYSQIIEKLTINLLQLRKASDDYRRAQKLMGAMMIKETLNWLSTIGWVTQRIGGLLKVFELLFCQSLL